MCFLFLPPEERGSAVSKFASFEGWSSQLGSLPGEQLLKSLGLSFVSIIVCIASFNTITLLTDILSVQLILQSESLVSHIAQSIKISQCIAWEP